MKKTVLHGQICYPADANRMEIAENSWLLMEDGVCRGVFRAPEALPKDAEILDYHDCLIIPGMTDLHLHAPQFSNRGLGTDLELLEWLNTYTFPEEAKYEDLAYAAAAYDDFCAHLLHSTTTRACIFATIHVPATVYLMQKLEKTGLCCFVGKVNMNRNSPNYLREPSTRHSVRATRQWLEQCADLKTVRPILTPRFIPSCTDDLMYALSDLRMQYNLPVQSHLSENLEEIRWVRELCPSGKGYADAYDRFGLLGGDYPCIMAHCVHSDEREQALLKKRGVFIAHSPESNTNLASGVAPVSRFLENGLHVGLATDVSGGTHESMLRAMVNAIAASKLRWRLLDSDVKPLSFENAFYLATMGGGAFFGKVGTFKDGYAADAVVLDDSALSHPQPLSVRARLERMIYLADDRQIRAKFVNGRQIL